MGKETKRYRVRPKTYLCLTPEEALSSGISIAEETLEELTLIQTQGFGYQMYAALRNIPEEQLIKIPVHERNENIFDNRKQAINYIKSQDGLHTFLLYGVIDIKVVERSEINIQESQSIDHIAEDLKNFNI